MIDRDYALLAMALIAVAAFMAAEKMARHLAWTLRDLEQAENALDKLTRSKIVVMMTRETET